MHEQPVYILYILYVNDETEEKQQNRGQPPLEIPQTPAHTKAAYINTRFKSLRCLDKHGSLVVLFLPSNIYI